MTSMVKSSTSTAASSVPSSASCVSLTISPPGPGSAEQARRPGASIAMQSPSRKIQPARFHAARSGRARIRPGTLLLGADPRSSPIPRGCAPVVSCAVTSGCNRGAGGPRPPLPAHRPSSTGEQVPADPAPGQDEGDAEERPRGQALQQDARTSQRGPSDRGRAPTRRGGPGPGAPTRRRRPLRSLRLAPGSPLAPASPLHDGGAEKQPEEEHDRLEASRSDSRRRAWS